jgi:hypothetical protein
MAAQYALACASNNLHFLPDPKSSVIHALNSQERLQVLEETGGMLRVLVARWRPAATGYVLKSGVLMDAEVRELFPRLEVKPVRSSVLFVPVPPPSCQPGPSPWLRATGAEIAAGPAAIHWAAVRISHHRLRDARLPVSRPGSLALAP